MHLCIGNAVEEFKECVVLFLETVIKLLGNLFCIKGCLNTFSHFNDVNLIFLFKVKENGPEFLDEGFARLSFMIVVFKVCIRFSLFPFNP